MLSTVDAINNPNNGIGMSILIPVVVMSTIIHHVLLEVLALYCGCTDPAVKQPIN